MQAPSPIIVIGDLPDLNTDCACPTPPVTGSPAAVSGGAQLYQRADDLFLAPIEDGWAVAANTLAGGAPALLNEAAQALLSHYAAPAPLATREAGLLAQAQLIVPPGTRYQAPPGEPPVLTAWLHVTNACNLDCPYCYIRKSSARMDLETGRRAVDALMGTATRRGFTGIKLKYAGGEAATHFRMVRQLHAYALERAAAAGLGLQAVLLSNGTVMPAALAAWLAESGVRLMLSVDGVGAEHDIQRPFKGGEEGAFAALERNLEQRLLPLGVRPDICITVTGRTAHTAHRAVRWALDRQLPFSINFYREHEHAARVSDLRLEEGQIIAGIRLAYDEVARTPPAYPVLDGLLDRVQAQAHGHTCGVGKNYVVITHEGRAAQCQMDVVAAQEFGAGSDLIGIVAAGPLHNPSVDDKEGCRDCRWRYRCSGGCPIVTLRATGRTDVKSPNCQIYQQLLPESLQIEGLRLLRHKVPSA